MQVDLTLEKLRVQKAKVLLLQEKWSVVLQNEEEYKEVKKELALVYDSASIPSYIPSLKVLSNCFDSGRIASGCVLWGPESVTEKCKTYSKVMDSKSFQLWVSAFKDNDKNKEIFSKIKEYEEQEEKLLKEIEEKKKQLQANMKKIKDKLLDELQKEEYNSIT